ncbi:hypothetical protein [Mycetocola sp.]|uniref:hypothetical protein n=1 Tax=Mycetocola sp. TaxID=1871042 RepID=UPI00398A4A5A
MNEYALQRLIYKEREYGINVSWADLDPANPSVFVIGQSPGASRITYNELIAIGIREGGYLKYGARKYGINLTWSETPVFEWRITPTDPMLIGSEVQLGQPVGLVNEVANDTLFYDPRRYGINLKWLRDKGKYNSRPWYAPITDAISGFVNQLVNLLGEIVARTINFVDFLLTLVGIMIPKKVKVRILILRDSQGVALLADPGNPAQRATDEQQIQRAVAVMRQCLERINVTAIVGDGKTLYEILPFPAPGHALDVKCNGGALGEDYKATGRYFRSHTTGGLFGSPITIFVVRDVEGKVGCSLGPLSNYVTVEAAKGFADYVQGPGDPAANEPRPTTPMHEIGHACGLWHKKVPWYETDQARKRNNLMKSGTPRGTRLTRLQRAILRSSRHVTYTTTGTITD